MLVLMAKERVNGLALGAWFKRQRNFRDLKQPEVATRAGKTQGYISKLESGQIATVLLEDVAALAFAVNSSEAAALRAIGHRSAGQSPIDYDTAADEEAEALAESYRGYSSADAREILRKALAYADAVERQCVIGGKKADQNEQVRN